MHQSYWRKPLGGIPIVPLLCANYIFQFPYNCSPQFFVFHKIHCRNEQRSKTRTDHKDVVSQKIVGKESEIFPRNFESDSSDQKTEADVEEAADVGHEARQRTVLQVRNKQILDESAEKWKNMALADENKLLSCINQEFKSRQEAVV